MAQVVCRLRKFKDYGALGAAGQHNHRPPGHGYGHVDPDAPKPVRLVGDGTLVDEVRSRIGARAVRKNAVLAVEFILSASPDYFRPDDPTAWGTYKQDRLDDWVKTQQDWLIEQFGQDNLVDLALHLDEATPHLHAVVVPIRPTDDKLAAAHWFDGPAKMRLLQDSSAVAVAHLGIERGELQSVATHRELADYYRDASRPIPPLPKVRKAPPPLPAASAAEKLLFGEAAARRRDLERSHALQLEQRSAEMAVQNRALRKNYLEMHRQASAAKIALARAVKAEEKAAYFRKRKNDMQAELAKFRDIPLAGVLCSLYGAKEADDSRSSYKTRKFDLGEHRVAVTNDKWIDNATGVGGVGAINLVKYLSETDFKGAMALLRESHGGLAEAAAIAESARAARKAISEARNALPPMPPPDESKWAWVRRWLTTTRKLPADLVDRLHDEGRIYANKFGGCVFKRDFGGFAIRGTGRSSFKQTVGCAADCGGFTLPGPGEVWLVEGPLDALSVKAMHPDAHVIAMLGTNGLSDGQVLSQLPAGRIVNVALDNDVAGERRSRNLSVPIFQAGFETVRRMPRGKDWNEDLPTPKVAAPARPKRDCQERPCGLFGDDKKPLRNPVGLLDMGFESKWAREGESFILIWAFRANGFGFRDLGDRIDVFGKITPAGIDGMVALALQKFPDGFVVDGTDEFCASVAEQLAKSGWTIDAEGRASPRQQAGPSMTM